MSPVDPTKDNDTLAKPYYMPHHCVEKPDSATTKLRVVFDVSCATDTGVSLNDALMVGHIKQDDVYSIILRFRLHRFAIVADLEKMYRQVLVQPSDRHLQRILWRDSPNDPIQCFELKTVTYGTASAPFLATRCLQQLALDGTSLYPRAARALSNNFYIDDLLGGSNIEEEETELCGQLIALLQSAGFKLHKWASNNPSILKNIPVELRENRQLLEIDASTSPVKTLGLLWQPIDDVFRFKVPEWAQRTAITKRIVLSDAARLFDPLGLLGPTILLSKLFMQKLWALKLAWDVPLEEPLQKSWREFFDDLEGFRSLSVPRWAAPATGEFSMELHGFCDASERAYGACFFLRTVTTEGTIAVHLLTAKSKVVPCNNGRKQRPVSLPRLELSAALLLSHLYEKVQGALQFPGRSYFWTDSTIVIHWLAAEPSRWKKFVSNRVAEIQHITAAGIWGHVAGIENPADAVSRGMPASQLIQHNIWWNGPTWLSQSLRIAQQESFSEDIRSIQTNGQVKVTSKLKSLSPILVDNLLRVRGRLRNALVPYDQKQPMILDSKHPLALLIVRHYHVKLLHAGPQLLMSSVRQRFWPLRLRNLARYVVHHCVTCFRCKPSASEQLMADLPSVRVSPVLPFLNSGVDFCGPFHLRPPHRKAATQKCYAAVFVCMSTKAVHLELVSSLSAESFLAALIRFAARRGVPKSIYCDNATNFVGTRRILNEFLELFRSQQTRIDIMRQCSDEGIEFCFIPPRSPHFGGLWEAAVMALKTHLYRTLKTSLVTPEQMLTILTQVEACLNSRPLTQLSNDPDDIDVLTAGHFLAHRQLTAIPEPSYEEVPSNLFSSVVGGLTNETTYKLERWYYNLPPLKWRFGRVIEIFAGSDNRIRVISIRTKEGVYRRAINRVCVLPIEDNQPPNTATFQSFEVPAN
ncbi:uncharacterized protein LOC128740041 [Sabethes cyaneus]|uniref:uncharacterized protein LOC128740041 n=1 Tax=Sabethes cyaneus TaxID=53552 RepID=UPI00237EBE0B|nr:uncharacterized protein LOC128740041 [Sabethes cyaneus]